MSFLLRSKLFNIKHIYNNRSIININSFNSFNSFILQKHSNLHISNHHNCIMCFNHLNNYNNILNTHPVGGGPSSSLINNNEREVLPKNVKPTHYKVNLTPNFKDFKFKGTVDISLNIIEDTNEIVTNALQLEFIEKQSYVTFKDDNNQIQTIFAKDIIIDEKLERVIYKFDQIIKKNSKDTVLHSSFIGIHNDEMAGFYRSGYINEKGEKEYMVVTQFEATDCRRALPSWDEPNLKCTFDVILNIDKNLTGLSNMQVISESNNDDNITKTIKFATTPKMSTYLLAFVVGEFDYIETIANPKSPKDAKPITCRVYTRKGQIEQGKFALEVSAKTLEFFSSYFEIAYPLPKMDMIAIPDFSAGAMENWGLVTYRDVTLLYDEKNSSSTAKQHVAYVVGHELAHQWFGNLVTMDWWNELWLNEGFATFVGTLVVDHLYPEWKIWTQFITNDLSNAMNLDSLRSSHPIDVDVKRAADIKSIFDHVSYYKGASVIRMLNSFLGNEVFRKGVVSYLKANQFSNATTKDLWDALSKESGKDVSNFMKTWIKDVGFPVVRVIKESYNESKEELTLTLTQERYLSSNDLSIDERNNGSLWWIPIGILTHDNVNKPITKILSEKQGEITIPYKKSDNQWWKLNYNTTGLYRVDLNELQIKHIGKIINDNPTLLNVEDRVGIINDTFELAKSGYVPLSNYLDLLNNFNKEDEYIVLSGIASGLSSIKNAWYRQPKEVIDGINKLQLNIFAPIAHKYGFEYKSTDDHLTTFKRTLALSVAASSKDSKVVEEFITRFNKYVNNNDESILNPNIRGIAYKTILRNIDDDIKSRETFDKILNIFKTASTPDGKLTALGSLGAVKNHKVVEYALKEIALNTDIIRPQDGMYLLKSISSDHPDSEYARKLIWNFVNENISIICDRYATSFSLLGHILTSGIQNQVGNDFILILEKWINSLPGEFENETKEQGEKRLKAIEVANRPIIQALERVRTNTNWVDREKDNVAKWVKENTN